MEVSENEPKEEAQEEKKKNERDELKKINKEEEKEFVKLFDEVLEQNRESLSDEEIADGVSIAIKTFKNRISGTCMKETYDNIKTLCGFFHRYSPLFATVTRSKFFIALQKCEELKSCFHHPSLKLVDIGSGAGSDLVGLFSALESYDETFNREFGSFQYQTLEVIAVDYNTAWKKFFEDSLRTLKKGDFGNASKLFKNKHIKWLFVPFNLSNLSRKDAVKSLKILSEADIILMKGFLSVLETDQKREKISENIALAMKRGSLLVIIESPTYEKYFQKGLRLVFTTRKFLPAASESLSFNEPSTHSLQPSTSQNNILASLDTDMTTSLSSVPENRSFLSQSLGIEPLTSDTELQASVSESDPIWENYNLNRKADISDKTYLSVPEVKKYGSGFANNGSTQQIFVLVKE